MPSSCSLKPSLPVTKDAFSLLRQTDPIRPQKSRLLPVPLRRGSPTTITRHTGSYSGSRSGWFSQPCHLLWCDLSFILSAQSSGAVLPGHLRPGGSLFPLLVLAILSFHSSVLLASFPSLCTGGASRVWLWCAWLQLSASSSAFSRC